MKAGSFFLKAVPGAIKVILGARVPVRVTQYITYRCNLNCRYCARHKSGGLELTTGEVKSLMASFRKAGTLFWGFNGGEALVREDIGDLIDFGKSLGLFVSVATNGTLLAKRYREVRNADLVNISLDGPKEVHDELRPGSYDLIREGVSALAANKIKFTFLALLSGRNLDSLGFILDLAERYRTKVFFQPIRVQKEDPSARSRAYFPTRDRMQKAVDYLLLEKRRGRPVAASADFLRQIRAAWPDGRPDMRCWAGKLYCSLTPEGEVAACCDTLEKVRKIGAARPPGEIVGDFYRLPAFKCSTCYAAIPLESNIALSLCLRDPLSAIRHAASLIPWRRMKDEG